MTESLGKAVVKGALGALLLGWTALAGADEMQEQAVLENIRPVGTVKVAEQGAADSAAAPKAARAGKVVFDGACMACHATGAAGAPKVGDKAAWGPRAAQGLETLVSHAVNGIRAMPPKGTCADCTEAELKGAILYMLEESGIEVAGGGAAAAPAPAPAPAPAAGGADLAKGEQVVQSRCFACHGTGAAGAPRVGDKAAWADRIAQGMDTLVKHALEGIRAMPPKGTCMDCSEEDIKAAVAYLVSQAQ